jgi:hypothetical protein
LPPAIIILKDSLRSATPSGEAKGQKTYAFTTQRTAQSRQLRADSIRLYGYAAYHCGNLQVAFLKLHLFGNGAGEGKIGRGNGKKLAAETSYHLKKCSRHMEQ